MRGDRIDMRVTGWTWGGDRVDMRGDRVDMRGYRVARQ